MTGTAVVAVATASTVVIPDAVDQLDHGLDSQQHNIGKGLKTSSKKKEQNGDKKKKDDDHDIDFDVFTHGEAKSLEVPVELSDGKVHRQTEDLAIQEGENFAVPAPMLPAVVEALEGTVPAPLRAAVEKSVSVRSLKQHQHQSSSSFGGLNNSLTGLSVHSQENQTTATTGDDKEANQENETKGVEITGSGGDDAEKKKPSDQNAIMDDDGAVVVDDAVVDVVDNSAAEKRFVSPNDFELLKVIGMGAFGKVLQVRNKKTKLILAMKVISKRLLKRKLGYVENVKAERDILTRVRSPFVVTMHCSFQTKEKLFIIMDFLAGGELFLRLGREGIFLESQAAFYLAEIILALDHLHALGILHRDLKPENILLGSDGHVCLTDFGLAKDFGAFESDEDESRALTICGTQEYMAPEMVARKGYGRAADYWSLGCIAHEMLSGLPPFQRNRGEGAKDLFRKIMSERVKMPSGASAPACKLLKGLLNRNATARWGVTKNTMFEVGGVAGLKKAEFFKSINWDKLEKKQVEPPVVLSVDHEEDLQHFHDEFTTMTLPRSVLEMSSTSFRARRVESENFRGFSFVQEDFELPERDEAAMQAYWDAKAEEDGESVSETASSKLDATESFPEPPTPAPKKRPPRKRKKKNKGGTMTPTPSTPAVSAANTPVPSVTGGSPPPSENGDTAIATEENPAPAGPSVENTVTSKAEKTQAKADNVAGTKPLLNVPAAAPSESATNRTSAPAVQPKPKPKQEEWTSVGTTQTKKSGRSKGTSTPVVPTAQTTNPVVGAKGLQASTSNATQKQYRTAAGRGWNSVPAKQQLQQRTAVSAQQPAGQWNTVGTAQRNGAAQASRPQQPRTWGIPSTPTKQSVARADGWGLQQQQSRSVAGQGQAPHGRVAAAWGAAPPAPPPPPDSSPSSDWRQHAMSPRSSGSSRQIRQVPSTGQVWPGLGIDPPLVSATKGSTMKTAQPKSPPKLQGAWASRGKR